MQAFIKLMLVYVSLLILNGCMTSGHIQKKQPLLTDRVKTIAVLPFVDEPFLRRSAGAWLAFRLSSNGIFKVMNDANTEATLLRAGYQLGYGDESPVSAFSDITLLKPQTYTLKLKDSARTYEVNWYPENVMQQVGELLGVDAVVCGYINGYANSRNLYQVTLRIVGLKMLDVRSGEVLLETQHGSYPGMHYNFHLKVAEIIDVAVADIFTGFMPGMPVPYSITGRASQ